MTFITFLAKNILVYQQNDGTYLVDIQAEDCPEIIETKYYATWKGLHQAWH